MAASTYDEALRRVLAHEGGYSDNPNDPGGPTNFGITLADYRRYLNPKANAADVRAMTLAAAKTIYRQHYWDALRCDDLSAGVDYAVFDYGVNSGVGRATKVLERIVSSATVDGKVSDADLALVQGDDAAALVDAICDERLAFLKGLKTWPVFGRGWERRVAEVRAAALAMAKVGRRSRSLPSRPMQQACGKGVAPVNGAAQKGSVAAVVVAGAAAAQQAHAAAISATALVAIAAITIAGGASVWLFWRWRQHQKQHAPVKARTAA